MPGNYSRNKGAAGEYEITSLLPGSRKLSRMYKDTPDGLWRGLYYEVKRLKDGWKMLYRWLDGDTSILFLRADRKPWLVVMTYEVWADLMELEDKLE